MNGLFVMTFLFFLHCVSMVKHSNHDETKRILLDDTDVLTRLQAMERQLASVQTDLQAEKSRNNNLETKVTTLETELANEQSKISAGAVYMRWGRTSCSNTSETVYSGFGAGQRYFHLSSKSYYGGPANFLCLPSDPEIPNKSFSTTNIIEGVEYESGNYFADGVHNNDMPCAVCRNNAAQTTLMIPGRSNCYSGWNQEYSGMLASGRSVYHSPSSYICVDQHPEFIMNGHHDEGGRELYTVAYHCGPLPCPPYQDNRQVMCVVCSK